MQKGGGGGGGVQKGGSSLSHGLKEKDIILRHAAPPETSPACTKSCFGADELRWRRLEEEEEGERPKSEATEN